jgi:hypothetical protein
MLLASVPVTIAGDKVNDGNSRIVWADACGQATECESALQYICSQKDADKKDHKCKSGCEGG